MQQDTVAIAFVAEAVQCLHSKGIDPEPVLAACGIAPPAVRAGQGRIPANQFSRLWLQVARILDDEFFDLDSRRLKVGTYATLCHNAVMAPRLGEALRSSIATLNIILDDTQLQLHASDDGSGHAEISLRTRQPLPRKAFAHETLLILLYGLMCWLIDKRIPLLQADFAYPAPTRWREYIAMFCSELRFDAPRTCMRFDQRFLDEAVVQNHRAAKQFLRRAPLNVIVKYRNSTSASVQVRRLLRESEPCNLPGFDAAAKQLGAHPARLRRDLEREGENFRKLRDEHLREHALSLLEQTALPVDEIARRVGFSEGSAFSRAFRRWTGHSPSACRDRRQQHP